MKISLILMGKTTSPAVLNLCGDYKKRINHYVKMDEIVAENSNVKSAEIQKLKEMEGALLLKKIAPGDFVILLDDKGKELGSLQFAQYIESLFNRSLKNICFVVGGAYGFSAALNKRANAKLSLSKMTFSHQIVRAIFMEQLYRAFTIIHKEPYHHE